MPVVLRYFDAQGRAQALRHALFDAGLSFEDVRVSIAAWPLHWEDPSFGGWFAGLPTLTWDADTVSETLSIASYVARRSGHYDHLGEGEIAKLEAVVNPPSDHEREAANRANFDAPGTGTAAVCFAQLTRASSS